MDPTRERALAERSAPQLGLITRPQLDAIGVDASTRHRLVGTGRLERIGRHTFRIAGAPSSPGAAVLAACLDTGGVASHRTAAALHGLGAFGLEPGPVDVTIRKGRRHATSPLTTVHTTTHLPPDDIIDVGPIPCTTVARTVLGLAALVPVVRAEMVRDVVDRAVRDGQASDAWLWWRLETLRCRGRNGVIELESILRDRAGLGRTEGWLERAMLRVISDAGLPLPVVQHRHRRRGAFVARVDFAYLDQRLVIEVDGHGSHATRAERAADARRHNELQLMGIRLLRFTYEQVVHRPDEVVASIAEALALAPASADRF